MCILQLNAQVPQYNGFAPGRRVCGMAPKLPIGTVDAPLFIGAIYNNDAPCMQKTGCASKTSGVRKSPYEAVRGRKLNLSLNSSFQELKAKAISYFRGEPFSAIG